MSRMRTSVIWLANVTLGSVPIATARRNRFFLHFDAGASNIAASAMNAPMLRCRNLRCRRPLWRAGASQVRGITAEFAAGKFHAIRGDEGCGKNLLLHLLGLLEQPDEGNVWLGNIDTTSLGAEERDSLRLRNFGFLFPACALLPSLSLLENIAFPVIKAGVGDEVLQAERTLLALQFCGMESEADLPVSRLSPERQAVGAFARAIAHRPRVLIAESPAAEELIVPLARLAVDEFGLTVVWGSRGDGPATGAADRVLSMADGHICAVAA
ncbi:MAG: ATP-binding cassette domain-containing protein [Chthoniobacterales bacterium]|nr:ATP-binding cassette domain-containing protein [Chthoniobacterales bacterium]